MKEYRSATHPRWPLAGGLVLCVLALAASASPAKGQSRNTEDPEVLIGSGLKLRKRGEDKKAHGYFERAYLIAPTPRTAAQLGLCDVAVGLWLNAQDHLSEALAGSDPWVGDHKEQLENSRAFARQKLGRIEIHGVDGPVTVTAGQHPPVVLQAAHELWVDPGTTHVKVEAAGFATSERDAVLSEGGTVRIEMAKSQVATSDGTSARTSADASPGTPGIETTGQPTVSTEGPRGSSSRVAGQDSPAAWRLPAMLTAAGLAAAALGLGIFETVHYNTLTDQFNDPGHVPLCRDSGTAIIGGNDCATLASDGDHAKTLAIVGYVGSGALALTAVLIGVLGRPERETASGTSTALSCAPRLMPTMGGLACALRF